MHQKSEEGYLTHFGLVTGHVNNNKMIVHKQTRGPHSHSSTPRYSSKHNHAINKTQPSESDSERWYCPYDAHRNYAQRGRNPCPCQHGARIRRGAVTHFRHRPHSRLIPNLYFTAYLGLLQLLHTRWRVFLYSHLVPRITFQRA